MKTSTNATSDALKKIEAGIEAVRDGDRFQEYLAFCARFHRYSFGNQLLIWSQKPDASLVAGFRAWLDLGRHVRKGEKGIMILAPMRVRSAASAEGSDDNETLTEKSVVYFRPVYVFDVSQTEGEELPSPATLLQGEDGGLLQMLQAVASSEGITISREDQPAQSANGYYARASRHIWVSPTLEPAQAAKTLAHELSHHFAGHADAGHSREEAEMIAESAAYIVMAHAGIDSAEYSFGYIASWGDVQLFRKRLEEIHATAQTFLSRLTDARSAEGPSIEQ